VRYLILLLLLACEAETDPPDPPPPPPDTPRFTAEEGTSPALRLEGTLAGDLTVEIWADDLGPVFGLAGRLAFDPSHLSPISAELAPDLLADSAALVRTDADAVVFGVTRKGAAAGDQMLAGSVLAGTVRFSVLRAGDSQLALSRGMVRRADGSFVPASFLGAQLHTVGGAP